MACLCSLACSAGAITFLVFLGKFAFNNPDADAFYGTVAGQAGLWSTEAFATTAGATDISDVHGNMISWFLWGFMNGVMPCAVLLLGGLITCVAPAAGASVSGCLMSCTGLSGFAWWIAGMVWRFRADGSFASGDVMVGTTDLDVWTKAITAEGSLFQVSSGNFMAVYYLITWILLGVSCGCSLLGALGACVMSCCK